MIVRAVCAAAFALLTTPSPTPTDLSSFLAPPIKPKFVVAHQSTLLDGPFDAAGYGKAFGVSHNAEQYLTKQLTDNGFQAGYGLTWHLQQPSEWMQEIVFAFANSDGPVAVDTQSQADYRRSNEFKGTLEAAGIPDAFAFNDVTSDGFHWTMVLFVKGNDWFNVLGGTKDVYASADIVSQAEAQYAYAPGSQTITGTVAGPIGLPGNLRTIAIAVAGSMLGLGVLVGLIVLLLVRSSMRHASPTQAMLSPDGKYWWDGTTWQPVTRP